MVSSLIFSIGIIILFSAVFALISKFFRQPLVLGYVLGGFLIGPFALGLIKDVGIIKQLAELGIAFLLFIVGLELDLNKFKQLGFVVALTGILQVFFVTLVSFGLMRFWLAPLEAFYLGLVIAFSSTMIVIKLISDKGELQTLHGKIVLGILLVQDILVVLALSLLQNLGTTSLFTFVSLLKGLTLILLAYLIGRYLFSYVLRWSASSPELLFIVALAIGFLYSGLAYYLGFSISIGAFIAGVALASSSYSVEIVGRVLSLKDFFLVIFFSSLGMQISQLRLEHGFTLLLVILVLVMIVKPLITFFILKLFKHSNRTCFSSSLPLGQISEFSLVLAGVGIALGHLRNETFTLIILVGTITITLTSYFIKYDRTIYNLFYPLLVKIETKPKFFDIETVQKDLSNHVVVIGAHRMASRIIDTLKERKENFVVLDYNPERVKCLLQEGVHCVYGDYGNIHVLENLHIAQAKIVISTVPNFNDNLRLIKMVKDVNKKALLIITSNKTMDSLMLYRDGADFVVFPEYVAGQKVADYLIHLNSKGIKKWGKHYRISLVEEIRKNHLFM